MLRRVTQLLLLVALLAAFVVGSAPAFRSSPTCTCHRVQDRDIGPPGGCHFDRRTLQCVNVSCNGYCY